MTGYVVIFLVGVLLASVGQVLMKKGAIAGTRTGLLSSFLNAYTISGYVLMLGSTLTSTIALKVLPLKVTVSLLPLSYVIIPLLSLLVLNDKMEKNQLVGLATLLVGVMLFNL